MSDAGDQPREQNDGSRGEESSEAAEPHNLSDLAKDMFEAGKFGECLVILEAAQYGGIGKKEHTERQKLVVRLHASAQRKDWWKALGLEAGAGEAQVRANYKKLAQQVHPDKCSCYGAEQAFQILGEAVAAVLGGAEGGFVKGGGPQEDEHTWWDKWDLDPVSAKKKRKREQEPPPQTEEEALNLRTCSIEIVKGLQELKRVVIQRQAAVLRPDKESVEAKLTAGQRQARVRAARAILNERLAYAENAPKRPGGFL